MSDKPLHKHQPTPLVDNDAQSIVIYTTEDNVISLDVKLENIWANRVLKDYLVKGYAINDRITRQRYDDLNNSDGSKRIADGTLVALTLMIAESHTEKRASWSK